MDEHCVAHAIRILVVIFGDGFEMVVKPDGDLGLIHPSGEFGVGEGDDLSVRPETC